MQDADGRARAVESGGAMNPAREREITGRRGNRHRKKGNNKMASIDEILTSHSEPELAEVSGISKSQGLLKKFTFTEDEDNMHYVVVMKTTNALITVHVEKAKVP